MVHFRQLKNDKNNRNIRAVVPNGPSHINIFEPSTDDIMFILDEQENFIVQDGYQATGIQLIKKLFPRFTDIEGLDELTDEEIEDVINNPTIALMSVKTHIDAILSEVYRMIATTSRNKLLEADFDLETTMIQKESFDNTIAMANRFQGNSELEDSFKKMVEIMNRVDENSDEKEVQEMIKETQRLSKEMKEKAKPESETKRDNIVDLIKKQSKDEGLASAPTRDITQMSGDPNEYMGLLDDYRTMFKNNKNQSQLSNGKTE